MNSGEVISEFTFKSDDIDCLIFEPPNPVNIVISFTGMNSGKYDRWSWYYEWFNDSSNSTMYIVLRDEEHLFYLNRPNNPYKDNLIIFINSLLKKHSLNSNNLITIGSSMGGYAALYYGFALRAGLSIASVPLADLQSASLHQYSLWTRKISEVGEYWIDLDEFLNQHNNSPDVFLIHGSYPADIAATDKIVRALESAECNFIRDVIDKESHEEFLTKNNLKSLIDNGINRK